MRARALQHWQGEALVEDFYASCTIWFSAKVFGPLLEAIQAIFFFGTPHKGSNIADTAGILAPILNVLNAPPERMLGKGKPVRPELIKELEAKSPQLEALCSSFVKRTDDLNCIVSLSERYKVKDRLVSTPQLQR